MKISNDFKKLWIDKKGTIEGMLEVEVTDITSRKDGSSSASVKICLKDNEEDKLVTFGPIELYKGETMTLAGLKVSMKVKLESN